MQAIPIDDPYTTQEALLNLDDLRLRLQTQLTPTQLEFFLSPMLSNTLLMSLREVNPYSLEVVKDRLKDFSDTVLQRVRSCTSTSPEGGGDHMLSGGAHDGLTRLGVIIEDERTGEMMDQQHAQEIRENIERIHAQMGQSEQELYDELVRFTEARTELKALLDSRLRGSGDNEKIERWIEGQQRGCVVVDKQQQQRVYCEGSFRKSYEEMVEREMKEEIDKERKARMAFKERLQLK